MAARTQRVFISYPKSGRTWVRHFLQMRGEAMRFTHAGAGSSRGEIGRRFRGVTDDANAERVIFMHRNPIDTAISFYFQVHHKDMRSGSWQAISRLPQFALEGRLPPRDIKKFVLHPGYGVPKICEFNSTWLSHLEGRGDALVMTYESARADAVREFTRLLKFVGGDTSDVAATVEQVSFDAMKAKEQSGSGSRLGIIAGDPNSAKVRRGKIGGYVDYLDAETIERCAEVMKRYGFAPHQGHRKHIKSIQSA